MSLTDLMQAMREVDHAPQLLGTAPSPGRIAISVRPEVVQTIRRSLAALERFPVSDTQRVLDRLRNMVDEHCGLQPVDTTSDELLTLEERHEFELRLTISQHEREIKAQHHAASAVAQRLGKRSTETLYEAACRVVSKAARYRVRVANAFAKVHRMLKTQGAVLERYRGQRDRARMALALAREELQGLHRAHTVCTECSVQRTMRAITDALDEDPQQ